MTHRITILTEHRYLKQTQPRGLVEALEASGARVAVVDPEEVCAEVGDNAWLGDGHLVVARGRSPALLNQLLSAETRGATTVNRADSVAGVLNKARMAVRLFAAGIPIPRTFFARIERICKRGPGYPMILKPVTGDNAEGLQLVTCPEQLEGLSWPEPMALAQEYLPNRGVDLKLYGIGRRVWAVRKPSPVSIFGGLSRAVLEEMGTQPVPMTRELSDLATRCANLFGLDLYGVDCIETETGPVVIEVNDFPNYTGIPDASKELAEFVLRRAAEGHPS